MSYWSYSEEDGFEESKIGGKVTARFEEREEKNVRQKSRNQKKKDGRD